MRKNIISTIEISKRLVALLLSFTMLAGFMPTAAFATETDTSNMGVGVSDSVNLPETAPGVSGDLPDVALGVSGVRLALSPPVGLPEVDSYWPSFRGNETNMAITNVLLPIETDLASINLKWNRKIGISWDDAPGNQIIVGDSLVVVGGRKIHKLSLKTGEIEAVADMVSTAGFAVTPPTYGAGMIFCALDGGTVQAFSAETLESLWVYTDPLGGQGLSPITYSDGYIYTGFWGSETSEASFVALTVTDEDATKKDEPKAPAWSFTQAGGFYWAGAVVVGDTVIVGGDNGMGDKAEDDKIAPSKIHSLNKLTGEVISSLELVGDQRSTIAYDRDSGKIYLTTKAGWLYSAEVDNATGELSGLVGVEQNGQTTSTPVVYADRVYFGIGGKKWGDKSYFVAADADTLEQLYTIQLKAYPQCSMLMTTAYEESTGYIYLYSTYNAMPGGISMIKLKPDATTAEDAELIELYDATGFQNYCIASLICGPDGTIYYKNDSTNILAVGVPQATGVTKLIGAIGTVSISSGDAIAIARNAYDALPEEEKANVSNYALLTAAEARLAELLRQKNADRVIALIDSIGTVNKNSGSRIRAARRAYNELGTEEKSLVLNYAILTTAERKYDRLPSQSAGGGNSGTGTKPPSTTPAVSTNLFTNEATTIISKLDTITAGNTLSVSQVVDIYKMYALLTDAQKAEVVNFEALEAQMTAIGKINHADKTSGIRVEGADWNIKIDVQTKEITDTEYDRLSQNLGSNTLLMLWNISLSDILTDGSHQPEKALTLRMPAPDLGEYEDIMIAHYMDDGSVEYIDCEVTDGELVWQVTGFSYYGIVGCAKESELVLPQEQAPAVSPLPQPELPHQPAVQAQEPTVPWVWIFIAAAGVAAIAVAVLAKSGKIFARSDSSNT